jgi:hypothetical protein
MSFLSDLAGDLKASVTKSATTVYNATLSKAETAVQNLFVTAKVGDVADVAKQTIPTPAAPQFGTPAAPLAPAELTGVAAQPAQVRYILAALGVAALIYFLKD